MSVRRRAVPGRQSEGGMAAGVVMTGRQRRVCGGTVMGTTPAGCGRWADTAGHPAAGLLSAVLAAAVLWDTAWRSGALRLPARGRRAAGTLRPSGRDADRELSLRLLAAADRAFATGPGVRALLAEDASFERNVLLGVGGDPDREYPPPGHTYPRS
ncbi:hypothetical protein ACWFQ8_06755 [Streptomyces sp. NPDC055254]